MVLAYEQDLFATVNWHGIGCALLSIVGSSLIILTYFVCQMYRIPSFKVIMFLSFADLVYSIQKLLMWDQKINLFDKDRCYTQAFL